ncbi:NAD(+)/NADH kinase [Ruminococcaceae bacterium OttesenSCG-928-A16]|nr:NAD(+)/NADH kinase [Ruminococcaceae bacterium OttesenSCG-928-A16]
MTVFLVPNIAKPKALHVSALAAQILFADGVTVLASSETQPQTTLPGYVQYLPAEQAYQACDIVVTIGGDGTMLHAARHTLRWQKPMLGINVGRLGFLTVVEKDELNKLNRLLKQDYIVEHRTVLQAKSGGAKPFYGLGLNDIVLFKKAAENTIELDIYCDEIKVSGFRGDGVVFSTPTGSTAYSMSAGGPIVDASLQATIVTQICAHIVHTPPMVFAGSRTLRAVPKGGPDEKIFITCDGLESQELCWNEPVYITQATQTVPLIQFEDAGQLESIDKKLKGR